MIYNEKAKDGAIKYFGYIEQQHDQIEKYTQYLKKEFQENVNFMSLDDVENISKIVSENLNCLVNTNKKIAIYIDELIENQGKIQKNNRNSKIEIIEQYEPSR